MPLGLIIPAEIMEPPTAVFVKDLAEMQKAVGGLIEPIELEHPLMNLVLNEDGLIDHSADNVRATCLLYVHGRFRQTLVGDALLLGGINENGEFTDVPVEMHDLLLGSRPCDVEIVSNNPNTTETIEHGLRDWFLAYQAAVRLSIEYEGLQFKVRPSY